MDDLDRDPVILNSPDLCQADMYAHTLIAQPETDFYKISWSQKIGSRHLIELQHTPVGFELLVHTGQHAINRQIRNSPTGLLFFS